MEGGERLEGRKKTENKRLKESLVQIGNMKEREKN